MGQYFIKIKPNLGNMTENLKASNEWKICLILKINLGNEKDEIIRLRNIKEG